ncbi:von Willebrand factor, type A [Lentisphaera araneosa HTCC2155]|uniref:von Willebrand factor, type A n=1 Tax=Lentisphaera araneosa HTCC2155 TaxID=313628 RepID=A6DRI1_9BACT|nr:VWA domain-containing protein [Lentisphaera araneosa]EDM25791.1 von Willebrand factor, type A [Lentisphaera araneosa HTCC2155]
MNINSVMRSLPLVAGVLGKRYGVTVRVGGREAYTDGKVIQLPALTETSDAEQLALLRGYIDHESAHVRYTNFSLFTPKTKPLTKHICNIFEDWRIEQALVKSFPGCRQNFDWLITHHFSTAVNVPTDEGQAILQYILLTVRSWDIIDIAKQLPAHRDFIEEKCPQLLSALDALLKEMKTHSTSTEDCLLYARKVVALISRHAKQKYPSKTKPSKSQAQQAEPKQSSLESLVQSKAQDLPDDMGTAISKQIKAHHNLQDYGETCQVAEPKAKTQVALSTKNIQEVDRASCGLNARLQALLQASQLKRSFPARRGRLSTQRLNRLNFSPKIFLRHEQRLGLNTSVHLLMDASGSMQGRMSLGSQASYALLKALRSVPGIKSAMTCFPGSSLQPSVHQVLKYDQPLHNKISVRPDGTTPLAPALWWLMQQDALRTETRKIIIILTDGDPDCVEMSKKAIAKATSLGFEIYGIGIQCSSIKQLLPDAHKIIHDLKDLAPALFSLLQTKLIGDPHGC